MPSSAADLKSTELHEAAAWPHALLLLLLALPVFFLNLGANTIWDANEAFYVETPRQMLLTGDYISPSFNGLPRFNKPVLSYWIVAGLYKAFGVSVTVERIGIAVGALGIVLGAYLVGRALRSSWTGLVAALMVATAPRVVMHARRIFIDVYLTSFLSLALAGFVLALRDPARRRRWLSLTYVALGLAVLTKGPIALALPALACGLWLIVERRFRDITQLMLLPGLLIMGAIVLPWYGAVYLRHGWAPITQFLFGENLERYTTAMTPGGRDFWFYLPVLLTDLFPWAPLVVLALATGWKGRAAGEPPAHASIRRLLWLWIVAIVVFFSFSHTKEDLYIFPATAAVAALVAELLTSPELRDRRATGVAFLLVTAGCVALAPAVGSLFGHGYYRLEGSTASAIVLGLTGATAFTLWIRKRENLAVLTLAAGFIVFNYLFVARVLPDADRFKPAPSLAATLKARAAPGSAVASLNMSLPSLAFYLDHPVPELGSTDDAVAFFSSGPENWLVTNEASWADLHARAPTLCLADRHSLFAFDTAKLVDVVRGTPPADALLVTNKCSVR